MVSAHSKRHTGDVAASFGKIKLVLHLFSTHAEVLITDFFKILQEGK